MVKLSYSEKLKDPRWQKLRLQILERDEWMCQSCSSKDKTLHVHHVHYIYGLDPWEYEDESQFLITLCVDCHELETQQLPDSKNYLFTNLAVHGFLNSSELIKLAEIFGIAPCMTKIERTTLINHFKLITNSFEAWHVHGENSELAQLWKVILSKQAKK